MNGLNWKMIVAFIVLGFIAGKLQAVSIDYLIKNVNVIDTSTGQIRHHQDVFVEDNRISLIQKHQSANQTQTFIIDGSNKFLIPGLMDMHVHYFGEDNFLLNLANGVTFIRGMWGDSETRNAIEVLKKVPQSGPTFYSTSELIDGSPPIWKPSAVAANATQAKAVFQQQKENGFDSLKVYTRLSEQAFGELARLAKAHNMTVVGHVPIRVGTEQAIAQGMTDIHHLTGALIYLQADNSPFKDLSPEQLAAERQKSRINFNLTAAKHVDFSKIDAYAQLLKHNNVWSTVTLLVNKTVNLSLPARTEYFKDKRMRYLPKDIKEFWDPKNDHRISQNSPEELEALSSYFSIYLAITSGLNKAGAKILAGSDTPNPFIYPGSSIHDELGLLVEAGLSNLQALQTATINPADFLNRNDLGRVKVGAVADLVLLEKNPLEAIAHTKTIVGVMNKGQWYSRQELTIRLNEIAQRMSREAQVK